MNFFVSIILKMLANYKFCFPFINTHVSKLFCNQFFISQFLIFSYTQ
jgi:hypothetical protein